MRNTRNQWFGGLVLGVGVGVAAGTTSAAQVAYESFETYDTSTSIVGGNDGDGWTGAWTSNAVSGTLDVVAKNLSAGGIDGGEQALHLSNVSGGANTGRAISRTFTQQTGSVFFTFLIRAENLSGNEFVNFYLSHTAFEPGIADGDDAQLIGAGIMLNQAGNPFFVRHGESGSPPFGHTVVTSIPASTTPPQSYLLVLEAGKTVNNFYSYGNLWIYDADDTLPATPGDPDATALETSNLNSINLISMRVLNLAEGESIYIDEVTISNSWPIPEPAGLALLGVGGAAGLLRRRRS